jgi:hypothetical protein
VIWLALLYLAPALLLAIALLAGRYPGEVVLARIAARRRPRERRPRTPPAHHPTPPPVAAPHGGLLLARALAGRGPPRSLEV